MICYLLKITSYLCTDFCLFKLPPGHPPIYHMLFVSLNDLSVWANTSNSVQFLSTFSCAIAVIIHVIWFHKHSRMQWANMWKIYDSFKFNNQFAGWKHGEFQHFHFMFFQTANLSSFKSLMNFVLFSDLMKMFVAFWKKKCDWWSSFLIQSFFKCNDIAHQCILCEHDVWNFSLNHLFLNCFL